jgi:hypothetical protein
MKAPAAGKREDRFDDLCAGALETALRLGKVVGIEAHKWPAWLGAAFGKAPGQPSVAELTDHSRLRQAYLTADGKASIRVRIKDNRDATLTIKSRGAELRRLELEYAIPTLEAEALIPLRRGSIIEKVRHKVPFGGLIWEIDEFAGENAGLAIRRGGA